MNILSILYLGRLSTADMPLFRAEQILRPSRSGSKFYLNIGFPYLYLIQVEIGILKINEV